MPQRSLLSVLLVSGFLTACGGGGGGGGGGGSGSGSSSQVVTSGGSNTGNTVDDSGTQVTPIGTEFVSDGTVTDAVTAAGIGGALVDVPFGASTHYTASSAIDGKYALKISRSQPLPTFFTGTVNAGGYLPGTIFYRYDSATDQLFVLNNSNHAKLTPIAANTVLFLNGTTITHLGDGNFTGTPNSQLQVENSGLMFSDSFDWTPTLQAKYQSLTISMYARGVETTSKGLCNQIVVGQWMSSTALANSASLPLVETDSKGAFTQVNYTFVLSSLPPGKIGIQILSGAKGCAAGSDHDDFEIVSVTGHLGN